MNILYIILWFVVGATALKAWTVGSDFNFVLWFKYGREYLHWYDNRPTFPKETPNHF
jgi:hypothetical protein